MSQPHDSPQSLSAVPEPDFLVLEFFKEELDCFVLAAVSLDSHPPLGPQDGSSQLGELGSEVGGREGTVTCRTSPLGVVTYFDGWLEYWCPQCYHSWYCHKNVCWKLDLRCWTEQLQAHQRRTPGGPLPLPLCLLFPLMAGGSLCLHSSLLPLLVALTRRPGSLSTLSPLPSSPTQHRTLLIKIPTV